MDPYAMCPCGSGKKLKFCCTDLIGEIEKIHRMIEGDQPRAALQHVEQTLAKQPGRASLLDLKAVLQLSLDDVEAAQKTVEEFVQSDPQSATAHAQAAIIAVEFKKSSEAVDALQTALSLLKVDLPQRVVEAIGAVGSLLLSQGDVVSARAHLWLYESIMGEHDSRALELLVRMNQVGGLPLVLRDQLVLRSLPEGHPVATEMATIQRLAAAGKWRVAAEACDDLLPDHLDEPLFFYNRALLSGYLADQRNFVAGLRLYARQDIPVDDAVEAEAIAQLVDADSQEPTTDSVRVTYEVTDSQKLVDILTKDSRIVAYPLPEEEQEKTIGPKPLVTTLLLDRHLPTDGEELTREQVPSILGLLSHFGRQTDRPERLELVLDRNEQFDSALATLVEVAGEALGENEEQVIGSAPGSSVLVWRWHFPLSTPSEVRHRLLMEERHEAILKRWPAQPRQSLGGKTPTEAAEDPEWQLPLLAALLLLEQGSENSGLGDVFAELRSQLGLPALEPIDADKVDASLISMVYVSRVSLNKLPVEALQVLYQRALLVNAPMALRGILREALNRPDFDSSIPVETLYEQFFTIEENDNAALKVLDEARDWAAENGASCGRWDLLELQLHLSARNAEEAKRLLGHLTEEHMKEPEIAEQVYQLLHMIGALPNAPMGQPAGQPMGHPTGQPAAAADAEGGIWTPEGEAGSKGTSKLWTPD